MVNDKIDIGNIISQKLKDKQRSIAWLAKQAGCDDSNLRKILKGTRYINPDLLFQISIALEEDFFACYSNILNETTTGRIDPPCGSN